jgi:hypothetical protein
MRRLVPLSAGRAQAGTPEPAPGVTLVYLITCLIIYLIFGTLQDVYVK